MSPKKKYPKRPPARKHGKHSSRRAPGRGKASGRNKKNKMELTLAILGACLTFEGASVSELSRVTGKSRRTIYRYIRYLTNNLRGGIWSVRGGNRFAKTHLSNEQRLATGLEKIWQDLCEEAEKP